MKFFGNVTKLEAAIEAADSAINPALATAKILTLKVDGKDVPASEAPLANRISALLAVSAPGVSEQSVANLTTTNAELAARNESISTELATATSVLGGVRTELAELTTKAANLEASVSTLTAEKAQLEIHRKAAQSEYERVAKEQSTFNTEFSKACLAIGCLQLADANGTPLSPSAPEEQKLEAANKIAPAEKLKAYQGGLNLAISQMGVNTNKLPGNPLRFVKSNSEIIARYNAEKARSAAAGVAFYRAHANEIDAAFSAQAASK